MRNSVDGSIKKKDKLSTFENIGLKYSSNEKLYNSQEFQCANFTNLWRRVQSCQEQK